MSNTISPPSNYIELVIRSREKVYYSGKALSLSSFNDKGAFDILPKHANFISMIIKSITVFPENGIPVVIKVDGKAVLRVVSNNVHVFLGI